MKFSEKLEDIIPGSRLLIWVFVLTYAFIVILFITTGKLNVPDSINFALFLILVIITAEYARITNGILNETQKDRKVRHLEKRLEKLYYPLKYHLKNLEKIDGDLLDSIKKYTYLASKELKPSLEFFLEQRETLWGIKVVAVGTRIEDPDRDKKFEDAKSTIKPQVVEDIKKYSAELDKLTS